jgi:phosphomannomutase/phosphoglucomutase
MKVNSDIFRAYDIRGIYPQDLNEEIAFQAALAFADIYPGAEKIVIAYDSRLSSPSLAGAVIEALVTKKREVRNLGLAPDSLFSFCLHHYNFDAGIMITASHNSPEYNGLILNYKGLGVPKENLQKIKQIVQKASGPGFKKRKVKAKKLNPAKDYLEYVVSRIKLKRPLNIVFDSGNGAVGYLPEEVFKKMECETQTIFGEPDGNFPNHLPDPYLEENLKYLKTEVLTRKADLGFAFDGDGDRVALIDGQGRHLAEDYCLLLLAKEVLKRNKGPVVHGVRVSKLFLEEMKKLGAETYWSVCHHNAIIEKIKEVGAVFGGEITSHYFFPKDYYLTDDALFSALKLAEFVSQYNNFTSLIDALPPIYASPEIFVKTPDKEKFTIIEDLKKYLKEKKIDFIAVDGARIQFANGWALARASNTSPYIKIRFEGKTKKTLGEIQKKALGIFKKAGINV